ncbi:THAP domain-containing protein 1 B-like [Anthonomus grandis grandis]|uniref:THAP domain-containing protein 1 B-like n=1 Tax=Anthonomus grandis grandis TaxID=2921223 RepID=UPI002166AA65|nr:THAP domain-containing protein 1 B-like [Anthonomus grandis grandis]
MSSCAVATCKNYSRVTKGTNIKYFRFPKDRNFPKQWANACHKEDEINFKNARICSVHFKEDCFEIPLREKLLNYTPKNAHHLKSNSVPTLHLPGSFKRSATSTNREMRMVKRKRQEQIEDLLKASTSSTTVCELESEVQNIAGNNINMNTSDEPDHNIQLKQSTIIESMETKIIQLEEKIRVLEVQNNELEKNIHETVKNYEEILSKVFT